jgi:hypothetical protein
MISEEGFNEVVEYAEQAYSYFSKKQDFGLNFRLEKEVGLDDVR